METMRLVRLIATLFPIIALLALGLTITLRSGVASPATDICRRQMASNLSQMIVQVVACLVGLAVLQQLAGFHLGLLR